MRDRSACHCSNSKGIKSANTGEDGGTSVPDKHIGPLDWYEKCNNFHSILDFIEKAVTYYI